MTASDLLLVRGLKTHYFTDDGIVASVDGVDFHVPQGSTVCIVGESGSGKTVTARSILRLISKPGRIISGEIVYRHENGETVDITKLGDRSAEMRKIRGREIAMVFQEPMTALSPIHTIGDQIDEVSCLHLRLNRKAARRRTVQWLDRVGIPKPEERANAYTFQLSGGMRQRAMIAMALVCHPRLLIADEPTTALDVTMQANILDLIKELQRETGMSLLFITHNLGVVAEIADEVVVMYLGRVVEQGLVRDVLGSPKHPYTRALLRSMPRMDRDVDRLEQIPGSVPHPLARPAGCSFHPRCRERIDGVCDQAEPAMTSVDGVWRVSCFLHQLDSQGKIPVPASDVAVE